MSGEIDDTWLLDFRLHFDDETLSPHEVDVLISSYKEAREELRPHREEAKAAAEFEKLLAKSSIGEAAAKLKESVDDATVEKIVRRAQDLEIATLRAELAQALAALDAAK